MNLYPEQDESGAGNAPIILLPTPGTETFAELTPPVVHGAILVITTDGGAPGDGYAPGDTGTIEGGDNNATYRVDSVILPAGTVETYHVVNPGSGYSTDMGGASTINGPPQPGVGTSLVFQILSVTP